MSKFIRIGVSVVLLALVAIKTEWSKVGEAFAYLRLELWLAAVALLLLAQAASTLRWAYLARALGFQRSFGQLTGIYFIGMYFNLLLPTSVGGDVVRAWYLDSRSGRRLTAFVSVFLDRVSGLLVLLVMSCVALVVSPLELPNWVSWFVWGATGCALLGLATVPLLAGHGEKGAARRAKLRDALAVVRSPRVLVGTTLMSLAVQAANVVIVWLIGVAISAPVPFAYYWIMVPMVSLLTMLPISVNGTGVREWSMVLFLAHLQVSDGTATALALLWFSVYVVVSLAGGLVYLFGRNARPDAATITAEETQAAPDIIEQPMTVGERRSAA
ncbi:MAG TPA: lysylphosphatidylglycerol synthase transmembrane domain-containing protein [Gemmataceae bacterium]|nr:lysylphosphatidylglycerol synthase transmembrane domain-containing protein [Gemmataceae bacterium]